MASLQGPENGRWRIQFRWENKSHTWRLGQMPKRKAEKYLRNLEDLIQCRTHGSRIDRDIQVWLEELPLQLKKRLQKTGLVWADGADAPRMWKEFSEWVLENHYQNKADNTIKNMRQAASAFVNFFGNCPIDSISQGDGDRWREAMLADENANATVSCYIKKCRTFFGVAVKYKMLFDNPFSGIKIPSETNDERKFYVDHLTIKQLLKVCSPEWAAAICLCRYGGLRCPSDVFGLKWEGVNFETGRITAWRKKTSHNTVTPMTPEVRHTLSNLWDIADEGEPLVFPYYGTKNTDRAADRQLRRLLLRS